MKRLFWVILLGLTTFCTVFGLSYEEFDCHSYNFFNKPCADCFGDGEKLTLPSDLYIARNVQELHMEAFHQSSVAIASVDMFSRYVNLSVLDIRAGRSFHVDEKFDEPDEREYLRQALFDLPNLKTLYVEYEEFNEINNSWILPPNLKELHLHHSVFEFDLYPCSSLETLIFTNHKLKTLPPLRDPPPPLRVLSLSLETSVDYITVNDIAPLCKLQRLEMVLYASEEDLHSNCECYRLQEWISGLKQEAEKSNETFALDADVYLHCPSNLSANCWNYTLDDAWKKRENCLWSYYGIVPKSLMKSMLVIALMIIVVIVLIVSFCGGRLFKIGSRSNSEAVTKSEV